MGTTQLAVFNRTLVFLGERRIGTLTEAREPQRVLTDMWADAVQFCLEQGVWNFALTSGSIPSSGTATIGYPSAFLKPAAVVHLFSASLSSTFDPPLVSDFAEDAMHWYARSAPLYVRYTSSTIGGDPAVWTQTFATLVAALLADWSALRLTNSDQVAERCAQRFDRALLRALAVDHVPMLPGMRPFNAEARALPVEGHTAQPIEVNPFTAVLALSQNDGGGGQQRRGN